MPSLLVFLNRSKVILVGEVTSYAVSRGAVMQSWESKVMFIYPVLLCANRFVFKGNSLLFPEISFIDSILYLLSLFYLILWGTDDVVLLAAVSLPSQR